MVETTWEKSETVKKEDNKSTPDYWEKANSPELARLTQKRGRWKFMVGGLLILASVVYLVISSTLLSAQFFLTVETVVGDPEYVGQTVRISGAVLGDTINHTIEHDPETNRSESIITFTISHIPQRPDNLAEALHRSVHDPSVPRLNIYYEGARPDLLQHEAQAILTGRLGEDGVFYANELLLKCPSRFEDGGSGDHLGEEDHPGMRLNAG
jgi:cytochrome c-type biogenesis protein CcmE